MFLKKHFFTASLFWANQLSRYIHDECYGVALDADGNYLIIGGWASFNFHISAFEGQGMSTITRRQMLTAGVATPGWDLPQNVAKLCQKELLSKNTKVSYLVVISPSGETVFSGVFGDKEGNNAGEWKNATGGGGRLNLLTLEEWWLLHDINHLRRVPHGNEKRRCDDLHW